MHSKDYDDKIFELNILNQGVGPAKLELVEFYLDNKLIENPSFNKLQAILDKVFSFIPGEQKLLVNISTKNRFISSGHKDIILNHSIVSDKVVYCYECIKVASRIQIKVYYESVYGQKYVETSINEDK